MFQVFMIGYARWVPTRFFCWAPYDSHSLYEISVVINDRVLSPDEVLNRYRLSQKGEERRAIAHVMNILQQYEETYGKKDQARVELTYAVNGKKEETWQWPPP